jgi:hypothetical protein
MKNMTLVHSDGKCLDPSVYFGGCKDKNQRYWWLWDLDSNRFVSLGDKYKRGREPIDLWLELAPGRYELGVGPRPPRGIRIPITVAS